MDTEYRPPFTMNDKITNLVIEIGELTGKIATSDGLSSNPTLRRINRIKTIYSSIYRWEWQNRQIVAYANLI